MPDHNEIFFNEPLFIMLFLLLSLGVGMILNILVTIVKAFFGIKSPTRMGYEVISNQAELNSYSKETPVILLTQSVQPGTGEYGVLRRFEKHTLPAIQSLANTQNLEIGWSNVWTLFRDSEIATYLEKQHIKKWGCFLIADGKILDAKPLGLIKSYDRKIVTKTVSDLSNTYLADNNLSEIPHQVMRSLPDMPKREKPLYYRSVADIVVFGICLICLVGVGIFLQGSVSKSLVRYRIVLIDERGVSNIEANQYEAALGNFEQTLKLSQDIEYHDGEWSSLYRTGNIYLYQELYDESLENYFAALHLVQGKEEMENEGTILFSIGTAYYKSGSYEQAARSFENAIDRFEQTAHKESSALTYFVLGAANLYLRQPEKTVEYYQNALEITQELGDKEMEELILENIQCVRNNWDIFSGAYTADSPPQKSTCAHNLNG